MSRSIAREVAMKIVYSKLLGGAETPDAVLEQSEIPEPLAEEDNAYAQEIVDGVSAYVDSLDELIGKHAVGWSVSRIARVDLAILRVAIFEMLHRPDVPNGAAINEAVELAKRFGGERSFAYVNGILGTVSKELNA